MLEDGSLWELLLVDSLKLLLLPLKGSLELLVRKPLEELPLLEGSLEEPLLEDSLK